MSAPTPVESVAISKFAELAGCDEKQVRRALTAGKLKTGADGKISVDQLNSPWHRPIRSSKSGADTSKVSAQVSAPSVRTEKEGSVRTSISPSSGLIDENDTPA